jgi:membrane-bound lytic murein transglycosylase D
VSGASASKPTVVVPADVFVYPGRKRVFYRVLAGDSLSEIATVLHVSPDELRRWNGLDASARLQGGMTLQAFVIPEIDLSKIVTSSEDEVRVLAVGSDEFFSMLEHDRGFRRILVTARSGDTIESIGRRYEVSPRTMERVNRRARNEALKSGEPVIVYLPAQPDGGRGAAKWAPIGLEPAREAMMGEAVPNGPLPLPPAPDLLP